MLTETPFYPYIENADALLREIALAGVEERYEVEMKDRVIARLEEELGYVRFQHSASGYLTVVNALRAVDAMPEDYRMAGTLASSLLSYVLGLSDISSSRKSRIPIFRIPWSSYHLLRISWRTIIFGKESPVRANGLFSVRTFSSFSKAYAD